MTSLNFEDYFDTKENKYYEPEFLITILENIFGKEIDIIKDDVSNTQIVVTKEQILEFLDKTFEEENLALKKELKVRNLYVINLLGV